MPDTKITALTALTAADPANDVLPIVDVSDTTMAASGTTKKISINNVLGCSGTATLASATISGNLTVDTSTFAVDAANNRVFVGTAPVSTAYPLFVTRGGTAGSIAQFTDGTAQTLTVDSAAGGLIVGNANNGYVAFTANGLEQYRIAPLGVFTWADGAGGTRMTLNSTGLGVGGSAVARIHAIDSSGVCGLFTRAAAPAAALSAAYITAPVSSGFSNSPIYGFWYQNTGISNPASECFAIRTNSTDRLYVDATGNVGIGVTPSAWNSSAKAFEIGTAGNSVFSSGATFVEMTNNAYLDSVSNWVRVNTGNAAARFRTSGSGFLWLQAAAGANPITWTQAMTLESTGSLVLGAAAVATTATDGFLYIPGCAGTPTGTPTAKTGRVPLVVDTTNNKLYFYSGGAWVAAN